MLSARTKTRSRSASSNVGPASSTSPVRISGPSTRATSSWPLPRTVSHYSVFSSLSLSIRTYICTYVYATVPWCGVCVRAHASFRLCHRVYAARSSLLLVVVAYVSTRVRTVRVRGRRKSLAEGEPTFVVSDDVVVLMLEIFWMTSLLSLMACPNHCRNPLESVRTNSLLSASEVNRFRERVFRWYASSLRAAQAAVEIWFSFHAASTGT